MNRDFMVIIREIIYISLFYDHDDGYVDGLLEICHIITPQSYPSFSFTL